ncbi:MAG: hypothetical protein ACRENL_09070 [Candidatus Dormibacteria bacterium]
MASPHVTMQREISAAGHRERSGALDVEWADAHATFYFMFGHPSHLVFEAADGRRLDGSDALEALQDELPSEFRVAPWRRAMVTDDTLHCTTDDLMSIFQRRGHGASNGHHPESDPAPADVPTSAADPVLTEPPFGFDDFPLLPLGTVLWSDAAANVVNLDSVVPHLRDSLLVLEADTCQAAALIVGGAIVDAVWVTAGGGLLGNEAATALMSSAEGTLTAHRIEDPRLVSALPMLWRAPRVGAPLPSAWLHTDRFIAEVRASGWSCCLLVDSTDRGAALFDHGELVAVYTAEHRWPATSKAALRTLLHSPDALVRVIGQPGLNATTGELVAEPTEIVATQPGPDTAAPVPELIEDEVTQTPPAGAAQPASADDDIPAITPAAVAADDAASPAAHQAEDMISEDGLLSIGALLVDGSPEPTEMELVDARRAREFVAPRIEIDIDGLRGELTGIGVAWLGADDSAPVAGAIGAARPGVDDFVATIAAIAAMEIPGHEAAVVRAMAREMHFRAAEVLCGV